jgi:peptidyl-prolyl cis-trans isomerase SurA
MMSRLQFVGAMFGMAAVVCLLGGMTPAARAQAAAQKAAVPKTPETAKPAAPAMPKVEGEEIDRVVAIVNGDLVLDSDVDEERRFAAFQPFRDRNADFSRDKAIERLINRDLILQQTKLQPQDPITDEDVKKELDALRKSIPECKNACQTEEGWRKFIAAQGFTPEELIVRWRTRMEVLRFIEERFRMGIRITPAEIQSYYEKTMLPEYARQHTTAPKLDAISDRIQEVLLQQQVSNLLGDWLKSLRAQGSVVVLKQGEVAP